MTLILEKKVQDVAQEYLRKKYRKRAKGNRVFSQTEVRTKQKYGSKRADGFIAFQHYIFGNYVVAIEAKSRKTLPAIRPFRDEFIFVKNSLKVGLLVCIASGAFFALFKMEDGLFQYLIPVYTLIISALCYALLTWRSYRHMTMDVIDQLQQYPGNEQWLAFSKDSFEALKKKEREILQRICKARGIGLLIVGRRVSILAKPKMQLHFFSDCLKYYAKEKEIRKVIEPVH